MKSLFAGVGGIVVLGVCACLGLGVLGVAAVAIAPPSSSRPATSGSAPSSPAVQAVGKVGNPVAAGGIELTVTAIETTNAVPVLAPKAGNTYLVAQVAIKNTERDESPYNPFYFKVKDAGGFEYNWASTNAKEPSLKSGKLGKGETVAGWVAFEVPVTAKGFVLTYEPAVIGGGYKPIRVDLGR